MRRRWMLLLGAVLLGGGLALALGDRPVSVGVVHPEKDVALRLYGLGSVEARVLSRVGFEVGAALESLAADAGDRVEAGQELASLRADEQVARVARARAAVAANAANQSRAAAAVQRAEAMLAQRVAANSRQTELARQNVASAQRAEEAARDENVARADLALAEADLAVTRAQAEDAAAALALEETLLSRHRLRAPYSALVVERTAEPGTVLRAGEPIFTLIDADSIWIQAYIDEERAGQLALGQPASLRLRSRPSEEFHATLSRIGLESDRVNEERRVWLTCADCPAEMFLGEQADVRILTGRLAQALMVPEVAISGYDGHRGTVWTVQDGRLGTVMLDFGARDDRGRVQVAGGLPDGAQIVANPPRGLSEGRRARVDGLP